MVPDLDEDEAWRDVRRNYLASPDVHAGLFSSTRPELVLPPRLRAHQQEVIALQDCYPLRRLACALEAYPELLEGNPVALHKSQANSYLDKDDDEDRSGACRSPA